MQIYALSLGRRGKWSGVHSCPGEEAVGEGQGGSSFSGIARSACPTVAPELPVQVHPRTCPLRVPAHGLSAFLVWSVVQTYKCVVEEVTGGRAGAGGPTWLFLFGFYHPKARFAGISGSGMLPKEKEPLAVEVRRLSSCQPWGLACMGHALRR